MTKKKWIIAIAASVLVLAVAVALIVVLVGNGNGSVPGGDAEEIGVYYFDAKYDEYTLTLGAGNTFTLIIKGEASSGSYMLKDGALTLDFSDGDKENAEATLTSDVITLTYQEVSMRFLKKLSFQVTFETNGGSSVPAVTVINGKTAAKPADPTRPGYLFVGWYADAQFKQPFSFEAGSITGDTVIYARWSEISASAVEYRVAFDLNYDGAPVMQPTKTFGGKVFDLPTVSREDYEFKGWWVSMLNDPAKLSYEYKEGMTLGENTTLYALWAPLASTSKLPEPLATVGSGSISWNAVSGARSYNVKVIDASGAVRFEADTSNTTVNVPFDTYAAGEYQIRVTALANSGDSHNSECVRYFVNRALDKVSIFNVVEPATLNFNTVPHAEKYLITVVCGNADHHHTSFDNGTSRSFSFANCEMTADGIRFTVTAAADGYASSTSDVFVYKRELAPVEGLRVDEATETVQWNEVPGASHYMVSVNCGNAAHSHGFVNNGSRLFVSLKECAPLEDGITVKVYPVARDYISPAAAELTFHKTSLPTPSDIRVSHLTLTWSAVAGATAYEVKVGNATYKTQEESFDLSGVIDWVEGSAYAISVRATGSTESLWSDEIKAVYLEKPDQLIYSGSIISWEPVIGAASYEVQVNDGQPIAVDGGATFCEITLTRAGINEIKVRFVDGANYSEWATISVFAHTVTFDTRGGSEIATQYKAVGDKMTLPSPTKTGYSFVAWYNVPGGPISNGRLYTDEVFSESGSIVLYAYYTAVEVNVTLNTGAEAGGEKLSDAIGFEEYYQLAIPTPLSPTMAFGGWYSAPYGMGAAYTDAKGNAIAPWDSLEGVELYAFWIDYALSFTPTKVNGIDAYMVSAGERISMLQEVTVPENFNGLPVAMVAGNAFKNCTTLKAINLPSSIAQISLVDPFTGCTALEEVNVYPVGNSSNSRYFSDNGVLFDNGTASVAQPKLLFMPLAKTGSYRIPAGIVEIPEGAFANSALSRITVPASVTRIGTEAFANCSRLTSVTFEVAAGAAPLTISARAFLGCVSLEKITLPARLSSIALTKYSASDTVVALDTAENAFAGCISLNAINVASGNTAYKSVGGILYSADGKTLIFCPATVWGEFTVPVGTQTISPGAFIGCVGLTKITLPNTVTTIGDYAFYGLKTSLTEVTFSGNGFNDVTIGKYAFRDCTKLTDIHFEAGSRLSLIDEGAFYGCGITAFEIPATVTRIGKRAFYNCTQLASLRFAENGKTLAFEEGAFEGCHALASVHIPANVSEIPGIFNGCSSLVNVTIDEANPYFESEDGVVFNKGKTELLFFPHGKTGVYTVPASVTVIANGVFSYNTGITKLILPNTLTKIGDAAFRYSEIKEIVFTGNDYAAALHIGESAFEMTTKLRSLALPAHTKSLGKHAFTGSNISDLTLNEGLETIGEYAFSSTFGLLDLTIPASVETIGDYCFSASLLSSITLNEGLKTIGKHAFENSYYLSSVTIPASVTKIDDHAFSGAWLYTVTFAPHSELAYIGAYAFSRTQISSIELPSSVSAIGAYAFYYCTALETVSFAPGGSADLVIGTPYAYTHKDEYTDNIVTDILEGHVFEKATNLRSVVFPSRLVEIKERSFESAGEAAGALTVSFGEGSRLTTIGAYCFYNSALTAIVIPASVRNLAPVLDDDFGRTYDRLGIGAYAFAHASADASRLTSVSFELGGEDPLTIGEGAFANAFLLTSVTLPKRLAPYTRANGQTVSGLEGGADVFAGVGALGGVVIEEGGSHYADIGGVVYTADFRELIFCPVGYVGEVSVPASVEKINDKAFYNCAGVTAIRFAGGDKDMVIGNAAFAGCKGITTISLPTNAVSLGEKAFSGCTKLQSITLSPHIDSFEGSMIENCPALRSIIVAEGNAAFYYDNGALYNADKTVLVLYTSSSSATSFTALPTTERILDSAFAGNTYLTTVILPAGLREIGASAFDGCTALSTIVIPNTVELIAERAFARCTRLAYPTFEKGGTAQLFIGDLAFSDSGLRAIELPARTAAMGDRVFASSSLNEITFEAGSRLASMGDRVFEDTALREISLPEGLVSIGDATFEGVGIERVSLPASLKTMGINTFRRCTSLIEVSFAQNSLLDTLPAGTFSGSSIVSITIPAGVMTIQDKEDGNFSSYGVFESCTSLTTVAFADNGRLSSIGQRAFYGCTSLKEIVIPTSVSTLGYMAFYGCTSLESVTIPATTTKLGHSLFYGCTALKNVTLSSKTTELPTYMFYNCTSLSSITIPSNVTTIGDDCFYGTSMEEFLVADGNTAYASRDGILYSGDLTEILMYPQKKQAGSITIPKEVHTIKSDIFSNASALKQVIFEEGGTQPLTIGAYAFQNCYQLHTVILPERLESIGTSAFESCFSLVKITIPSTTKRIEDYAFRSCYKLIEVYNRSSLAIKADSSNGYVGYYALNIYTPEDGESIVTVDENGYATVKLLALDEATYEQVALTFLVGYMGSERKLSLPSDFDAFYDFAFYRLEGIESIFIPAGAGEVAIGENVFVGCGKPTLLLGQSAVPSAWGALWNSDNCPVITGCDGEAHTYTFVTNCDQTVESITGSGAILLPTLLPIEGKVFLGWCVGSDLGGTPLTGSYYSATNTTLYAKWVNEGEEIPGTGTPTDPDGAGFDTAFPLVLGEERNVLIDLSGKKVYFQFTPSVSGVYHAYLSGSFDGVLQVWADSRTLHQGNLYADFSNPVIDKDLSLFIEGNTYYLVVYLSSSDTAELTFTLTLTQASSGGGQGGESGGEEEPPSFDNATELALGTETSAVLALAGDKAYFRFTPEKTGKYNIDVYGYFATLLIYSADLTTPDETLTDNYTGSINRDIELTAGVTYYFVLFGTYDDFHLYITLTEADEAPGTGGNTPGGDVNPGFGDAIRLVVGGTLTVRFSTANQAIYYVYTAEATGDYRIYMDAGFNYSSVRVYAADGTQLTGPVYDTFGKTDLTQSMTEGETYYIVVSMLYTAGTLDLTFSAPKSPGSDDGGDELAGGTGYDDAIELVPGTSYTVSCDTIGKRVYFKYTATETGVCHVYVSGSYSAMIQVWRDAENTHQSPVYANWGTGLIDVDLSEFTAGKTYYIIVSVSGSTADLEFIFTTPEEQA